MGGAYEKELGIGMREGMRHTGREFIRCQEVMVWRGPMNMKGSLGNGQRSRYHK